MKIIIAKKKHLVIRMPEKNAEIFEDNRNTVIRMLTSARKKKYYFTRNSRNKQPFIDALNLSQSKQPVYDQFLEPFVRLLDDMHR